MRIQEFSTGVPKSICHRKKCVFVVTLSLFFVVFYSSFLYFTRVKLFNFKVDYNFLRLQRGSNLFRVEGGGSICLFPIENHITCDFQGVWTPSSPSHLDWSMSYLHIILAQNTSSSLPLNKRMPNCVSYPKIPSKLRPYPIKKSRTIVTNPI